MKNNAFSIAATLVVVGTLTILVGMCNFVISANNKKAVEATQTASLVHVVVEGTNSVFPAGWCYLDRTQTNTIASFTENVKGQVFIYDYSGTDGNCGNSNVLTQLANDAGVKGSRVIVMR